MSAPSAIDPTLRRIFESELSEWLGTIQEHLLRIEAGAPDAAERLEDVLRLAHDMKGSARVVGLVAVGRLAHALEAYLIRWRGAAPTGEQVGLALSARDLLGELAAAPDDDTELAAAAAELGAALRGEGDAALRAERCEPAAAASREGPAAASDEAADAERREHADRRSRDDDRREGIERRDGTDRRDDADARRAADRGAQQAVAAPRAADVLRLPRVHVEGVVDGAAEVLADAFSVVAQLGALRGAMRRLAAVALPDDADGEIVTARHELRAAVHELGPAVRQLERRARELVDRSQSLCLVPVAPLVVHLERVARDAARTVGREVRVEVTGRELCTDVLLLESLKGPLTHAVRNAVDHGIEPPDERCAAGKPRAGRVALGFALDGDRVCVTVADDGRGIDTAAVRRRLGAAAQRLGDEELVSALLTSGISTREVVTEISGRGLGLGSLAATADRLRGELRIVTTRGGGTALTLELPMRLSVVRGLSLRVAGVWLVVPVSALVSVEECAGADVPDLAAVLGLGRDGEHDGATPDEPPRDVELREAPPTPQLVRLRGREGSVAVAVDAIGAVVEVVRRPLGSHLGRVRFLDGATIMPHGEPALILEVREVAAAVGGANAAPAPSRPRVLVVDDSATIRAGIQAALTGAGFDVVPADDGRQALERFDETPCDAVVSDVQMPYLDGFGVLEQLGSRVPVILVTSFPEAAGRERARRLGAAAYLGKGPRVGQDVVDSLRPLLSPAPETAS